MARQLFILKNRSNAIMIRAHQVKGFGRVAVEALAEYSTDRGSGLSGIFAANLKTCSIKMFKPRDPAIKIVSKNKRPPSLMNPNRKEIVVIGIIGNQQKQIVLSKDNPIGTIYHIMIDKEYNGQVIKNINGWGVYPHEKS